MEPDLKSFSAKNDLDFYYNVENIEYQDLVFATLEHFEKGPRKELFEPLQFINLLWAQFFSILKKHDKAHSTISALKALPLNHEQKHVLFSFILKWFGCILPKVDWTEQLFNTLQLIDKEFYSYEGATPEKEFCDRDWMQFKFMAMVTIEFNKNKVTPELERVQNKEQLESEENNTNSASTLENNPNFKSEAILTIFNELKDFFTVEHQKQLIQILKTGGKASEKLHFKDNGNRLTDTFKKLIEHDFITRCSKKDLENWIITNFTFSNRNNPRAFMPDTVEKGISRDKFPCKSPLIKIENGQIQKVVNPRQKNYNN